MVLSTTENDLRNKDNTLMVSPTKTLMYMSLFCYFANNFFYGKGAINDYITILNTVVLFILNVYFLTKEKFDIVYLVLIIGVFAAIISTVYNNSGFGLLLNYINLLLSLLAFSKIDLDKSSIGNVYKIILVSLVFLLFTFSIRKKWDVRYFSRLSFITIDSVNSNVIAVFYFFVYIYITMLFRNLKFAWLIKCILFGIIHYLILKANGRTSIAALDLYFIINLFCDKSCSHNQGVFVLFCIGLLATLLFTIAYLNLYKSGFKLEIMNKDLFSGRQNVWGDAYSQIKENWPFGNSSKYLFAGEFLSAHNSLLGYLFYFGIIGCFCVYYVVCKSAHNSFQSCNRVALFACLIIFTFESLLSDPHMSFYYVFLFLRRKQDVV